MESSPYDMESQVVVEFDMKNLVEFPAYNTENQVAFQMTLAKMPTLAVYPKISVPLSHFSGLFRWLSLVE